jgi:hypothetical protein
MFSGFFLALSIQQSLSGTQEALAIPLLILSGTTNGELVCKDDSKHSINYNGLTYKLNAPINLQELLLAVNFLLKLRMERLRHNAEKQQLLIELSAKKPQ